MPTVIDSLVVELNLNASSFTKEQQAAMEQLRKFEEETRRSGARIEDHEKRLTGFFSAMKRQALGLASIAFGGAEAGKLVEYITTLDAGVGRLSRTMNLSTRELSAWQGAIRTIGGSPDSISATLSAISTDVQRSQQIGGVANIQQIMGSLGFSIFGPGGKIKTPDQMLLDAAGALDRSGLDPAQRATRLGMIGGMNQDTLNLLMHTRGELEKMLEVQRQLGVTTNESAAAAEKYQKEIGKLETAAIDLGRTLTNVLGPSITDALDKFTKLIRGPALDIQIRPGSPADKFRNLAHRFWTGQDRPADSPKADATPGDNGAPTGSNWSKFLGALSYLETSHQNVGNATSSAHGYFQFLDGTAKKAIVAGVGDPTAGGYDQQAATTQRFIERFYPKAADAIARGDYASAEAMLKGEWPSLPGGSQPQNAARYSAYRAQLGGGGGGVTVENNISITTPTTDPYSHGKIAGDEVTKQINRSQLAVQANGGAQ